MLERSPALRKYENSSQVADEVHRLRAEADTKVILDRLIETLG